MIGRDERYPLVRHVTEDEIWPRPVSVSITCRAVGACLARPTIRSPRNPGWRGIRGALAAYPGLRCGTPTAYSSKRLLLANLIHDPHEVDGVQLISIASFSESAVDEMTLH